MQVSTCLKCMCTLVSFPGFVFTWNKKSTRFQVKGPASYLLEQVETCYLHRKWKNKSKVRVLIYLELVEVETFYLYQKYKSKSKVRVLIYLEQVETCYSSQNTRISQRSGFLFTWNKLKLVCTKIQE